MDDLEKLDWLVTGIEVPIIGTLVFDHFSPFLSPIFRIILTIIAGGSGGYILVSYFTRKWLEKQEKKELKETQKILEKCERLWRREKAVKS